MDKFVEKNKLATMKGAGQGPMHTYSVTVTTSKGVKNASTEAKVSLILINDAKEGFGPFVLAKPGQKCFEDGQVSTFTLQMPAVANLASIVLGHDNSGDSPFWHLASCSVENQSIGDGFKFVHNEWIPYPDQPNEPYVQLPLKSAADKYKCAVIKAATASAAAAAAVVAGAGGFTKTKAKAGATKLAKSTTGVVRAADVSAARPAATLLGLDGKPCGQVALPAVFTAPVRPDLVSIVHTNMAKNARQAYAVSAKAGHQTAAESWGTGRAVSRIPRVPGGGTHRAGQGAFGNMCRGGHMYAPTKTWRRWHRKINVNMKRYAVASALAASAIPALVMARGHCLDRVPEVPLVLDRRVESLQKTKEALKVLAAIGADVDVERAASSRAIRKGKGKMRNRRYVSRKGPLVIYGQDDGLAKAFRNIPGVDVACVDRLSLLQLAPGGHLGRFCIWTQTAVERLDAIFGSHATASKVKKGYTLPHSIMTNADLTRLINSDEIQSIVAPPKAVHRVAHKPLKRNALRNKVTMARLNPFAETQRKAAREAKKSTKRGETKAAKAFYRTMMKDSDYDNTACNDFKGWLGMKVEAAEAE